MDFRGDPRANQPGHGEPQRSQGSSSEWYLFYSPRSPPSMKFISQAKKVEAICSNINLINFDENPVQMVKENPWLREHGLPTLVIDGDVLSKKNLFDWLERQERSAMGPSEPETRGEPLASHLGEASFDLFSSIGNALSGEISTESYSSIGAKQGCEGIDHEKFDDSASPKLSLDALEAQRHKQLSG